MDMEKTNVKEETEPSWSETTTPASDYIEVDELVRQTPPPRPRLTSKDWGTHPRFFKGPIRRRVKPAAFLKTGVTYGQQSVTFSMRDLDSRQSVEGSDISSSSSSLTIITSAASSCTDPWSSSSGFVEEEEDEDDDTWERDDNMIEDRDNSMEEEMIVPKLEPIEEDVNMTDVKDSSLVPLATSESSPSVPAKRPRGRPRKHPKISLEEKLKVVKNRSKTGCITCRKRKKKCDEKKPSCMNCDKNGAICEGYQPKTIWKSGKERAQEAHLREISLPHPSASLPSLFTGIETPADQMFFEHYTVRLSSIFTAEGEEHNAFKEIFIPMAVDNPGLMHSILALASKHIDYQSPYGIQFLKDHPDVSITALEERSQFHEVEAMAQMQRDIELHKRGDTPNVDVPVTLAQMLCLVLQTLSNPKPKGEHRIHLKGYQDWITACPPEESSAVKLIDELMQYHICADELICLPESRGSLGSVSEDWVLPPAIVQPDAVRLLGVSDGLFVYMSKITNLRNDIRERMQAGEHTIVAYPTLFRASQIDAGIRSWTPAWPAGDKRDLAGLLYKYMMWVYLWRTIYPPRASKWKIDSKLTEAVNTGIEILGQFGPRDPAQTLILAPAFVLGCAAFEKPQREAIRRAIGIVKMYMEYKNSDTALEVLEEVWRLMDAKDERSWDWQTIAYTMGMDFLVT